MSKIDWVRLSESFKFSNIWIARKHAIFIRLQRFFDINGRKVVSFRLISKMLESSKYWKFDKWNKFFSLGKNFLCPQLYQLSSAHRLFEILSSHDIYLEYFHVSFMLSSFFLCENGSRTAVFIEFSFFWDFACKNNF
jgi:hypothetical protein